MVPVVYTTIRLMQQGGLVIRFWVGVFDWFSIPTHHNMIEDIFGNFDMSGGMFGTP